MGPAANFAVLQFAFETGELWPIAVLLLDSEDRLYVRARAAADLAKNIPPEDAEVVALSLDQIVEDARTGSGTKILGTLEDRLSNTIRISDSQTTHDTLDDLYQRYITHRK